MWWLMFAQAAEGGGQAQPSGSPMSFLLILIVGMFVIMYFLQIRPQQKREKERQEMLSALSKGDEVVTAGGIFGTIVGLTDKEVVLRVDEDTTMKFMRSSIAQVLGDHAESPESK